MTPKSASFYCYRIDKNPSNQGVFLSESNEIDGRL